MSDGFVSWLSLSRGSLARQISKLSILLFENVFVQTAEDEDQFQIALERAGEGGVMSEDAAVELAEVWQPLALPMGSSDPVRQLGVEPWMLDAALNVARSENPSAEDSARRLTALGLIASLQCWTSLHALSPCGSLASNDETEFTNQLFARANPSAFSPFIELGEFRCPDLEEIPWQRITELRDDHRCEFCRRKIGFMHESFHEDERSAAQELAGELFQYDLPELRRALSTTGRTLTVKAYVSRVPMPQPIFPLAMVRDGASAQEIFQRRQRFGWVYFAIERSQTHQSRAALPPPG